MTRRWAPDCIKERTAASVTPHYGGWGSKNQDRHREGTEPQGSSRSLALTGSANGLDQEPWHVGPRPNEEPLMEAHQERRRGVSSESCAILAV